MQNKLSLVRAALFDSKEDYVGRQLAHKNASNSFAPQRQFALSAVAGALGNQGALVSGEDDFARSQIIYAALRQCDPNVAKVVLHSGNGALCPTALQQAGLRANRFDGNLLVGSTRAQLLAQITNERTAELVVFYNFAFDVLEALGQPLCTEQLCAIDWLALGWQQLLLQTADRGLALDLLSRFDRQMAVLATKGVLQLERTLRGAGRGGTPAAGLAETLRRGEVLVVDIAGNTLLREQVLEVLLALAQRGTPLCLVADQVLAAPHPLLTGSIYGVSTVLSCRDITTVPQYQQYLSNAQNIVLLRHLYGSAKPLSEYCFGEYEKRVQETSFGQSREQRLFAPRSHSSSQSFRTVKELRLGADKIASLPNNLAVASFAQYGEGVVQLGG